MRFPDWLKWLVARQEMAELSRWRLWADEHHKWLSHEFPAIGETLINVAAMADGRTQCVDLPVLRERLRASRA